MANAALAHDLPAGEQAGNAMIDPGPAPEPAIDGDGDPSRPNMSIEPGGIDSDRELETDSE